MAIQQISVFLENKEGKLAEAIKAISGANVNIRALCVADTRDFGILRLITSNNADAKAALSDTGAVLATDVIAAKMDDTAGALSRILDILAEAQINIEYMYAFTGAADLGAYVVLRVNNTPAAEAILKAAGISTLCDDDVKSM